MDSLAAAGSDVTEVATCLHSVPSVGNASHFDGLEASELLALTGAPANVGPKGLLRRALRVAAQAAEVKRRRVLAFVAPSIPAASSQVALTSSPGDGQRWRQRFLHHSPRAWT